MQEHFQDINGRKKEQERVYLILALFVCKNTLLYGFGGGFLGLFSRELRLSVLQEPGKVATPKRVVTAVAIRSMRTA